MVDASRKGVGHPASASGRWARTWSQDVHSTWRVALVAEGPSDVNSSTRSSTRMCRWQRQLRN
jgi:hypothetical protein